VEGLMLALGYPFILIFVKVRRRSVIEVLWGNIISRNHTNISSQSIRLLTGLALLWLASHFLIQQVVWLSAQLQTTPFVVSLLLLSISSNLPELIVAIQAVMKKQTTVAYGNYLGSAIANTLIFGFLTVLSRGTIYVSDGLTFVLPAIVLLVTLFFFFLRSNKGLSRLEGAALIAVYIFYVVAEWQLR
jgi:cation:H+ antiporter